MKTIMILILIISIMLVGCAYERNEQQEAYAKCTAVCASVVGEEYTETYICNEECKKEFLKEE